MNKPNKRTELTTWFHTLLLWLYVADPATFLVSNSILGDLSVMEKKNQNISEFVPHYYLIE